MIDFVLPADGPLGDIGLQLGTLTTLSCTCNWPTCSFDPLTIVPCFLIGISYVGSFPRTVC